MKERGEEAWLCARLLGGEAGHTPEFARVCPNHRAHVQIHHGGEARPQEAVHPVKVRVQHAQPSLLHGGAVRHRDAHH